MDLSEFETALRADGFGEIETRSLAPNIVNSVHSHPFSVRLMVTAGEITITSAGTAHVLRKGNTFALPAGCEHVEQIGADGVTYLVGRKR